jgi:hypothetical protein
MAGSGTVPVEMQTHRPIWPAAGVSSSATTWMRLCPSVATSPPRQQSIARQSLICASTLVEIGMPSATLF